MGFADGILSYMTTVLHRNRDKVLLVLILCIALFFRFYKLDSAPPGLYPDVAMNGTNALSAIKSGSFEVFYPENNGREGLFINLQAFSMMIFGENVLALKVVAALIGFLTVLGTYFLVREVFGSPKRTPKYNLNVTHIALLSAFFMAVSFWHVNFSRIGFRAITVPFVLVWGFYFLYRALRTRRTLDFIASGIFFGLGFHTYISYRIAPAILAVPFFVEVWKYNKTQYGNIKEALKKGWGAVTRKFYIEDGWYKWDLMLLAMVLVTLPLLGYFVANPDAFLGRSTQVSVFASENPIQILTVSTLKTLGQFNFIGDENWRHNYAGAPQLFWPVGIFFLIGLVIVLREIFKKPFTLEDHGYLLFVVWLLLMLVPSFLSVEGIPHALRSIGAIPPAMIIAGIGGIWFFDRLTHGKPAFRGSMVAIAYLFLALIVRHEYNNYFNDWAQRPEVRDAFTTRYVDIGNLITALPDATKKYVVVNAGGVLVKGIPMPAQTVMFITHSEPNVSYMVPGATTATDDAAYEGTTVRKNSVIIPMEEDLWMLNQFQAYLPESTIRISPTGISYLEF